MRSLLMLVRHLIAIALLPFMVVVMIPRWLLARDPGVGWRVAEGTALWWLESALAVIAIALGFALFAWCVILFARVGQGTLAPWDPTRRLVAAGPYRHVRNPMISSVLMMLSGEALLFRSWPLVAWAAFFFLLNHAYFMLSEEPGLEARLGEPYRTYKANVPRWLPRRTPWPP